jgi:UDP-N-acetylglucosamine acyltransferase
MSNVHPTVIIEGDVTIGEGAVIEPFCYLRGPLVIGAGTRIYPHCVIGTGPEHKSRPEAGMIRIGAGATIRELTVIQRGTGDRDTEIGDGCFLMDHVHIGHDSVLGPEVTIAPNVVLAGHTRIHRGATIGMSVTFHQFSTIGAYAMVGMGSIVTRDVPPFALVSGNPARFRRFNTHAFKAAGLADGALRIEDGALVTDHAGARAHLEAFRADARRKAMALVASSDEA